MNIRQELERYKVWNEQEERDRLQILHLLQGSEDIYGRENNAGHLTASAWVTDPTHTKILMCYHRLYNSWSWLGGHADGERNLLSVAVREVKEESGLQNVTPVSDEVFSVEILTVDGHVKKGKYVSSHLHLNVTYLLEADPSEPLRIKEDENSGLKWFALDDAVKASSEPWFREHIYSKLNEKLKKL